MAPPCSTSNQRPSSSTSCVGVSKTDRATAESSLRSKAARVISTVARLGEHQRTEDVQTQMNRLDTMYTRKLAEEGISKEQFGQAESTVMRQFGIELGFVVDYRIFGITQESDIQDKLASIFRSNLQWRNPQEETVKSDVERQPLGKYWMACLLLALLRQAKKKSTGFGVLPATPQSNVVMVWNWSVQPVSLKLKGFVK